MRIPKNMLEALDNVAEQTNCTRNEILMMCIEFSLDNMDIDN